MHFLLSVYCSSDNAVHPGYANLGTEEMPTVPASVRQKPQGRFGIDLALYDDSDEEDDLAEEIERKRLKINIVLFKWK